MNRIILIIILFSVVVGGLVYLNKSNWKQPIPPLPLGHPEELVEKAVEALIDFKRKEFIECFEVDENEYEVLVAMLDAGESTLKFKEKFIKEYGEEAWGKFQDSDRAPEGADMKFSYPSDKELKDAKEWKYFKEAPKYKFPNTMGYTKIIKREKGFVFSFDNMLGSKKAEAYTSTTKMLNTLKNMTDKYSYAIGKENISAEDIDFQMGKELMQEFFGFKLKFEDRFDINDFIK